MCGITGMVYPQEQDAPATQKSGKPDGSLLRHMNTRLTHRGPDDEGYYLQGQVGLAMRRLKIIDLEGGHQPMTNETGEVWTVFNGEIYNFQELRHGLESQGHRFKTKTDTEVIVHLYEEQGEEFVHALRGMFAIALWDTRERKLLLYRDRLGIKPLHYALKNGVLIFGSEIKALLEHPEIRREISQTALHDYLSFLYIPAPLTIYQDIWKLPPGHSLRWQEGRIEIRRYWDLEFQPEEGIPEAKWVDRLRGTLEESVRLHRISDVPLGAFLSGGMDSSTVVALLSRLGGGKVQSFSMGFGDARYNELPYAREVSRFLGTDHHEQTVEPDAMELLPEIIEGFDEPFADSSAIPTYLVSKFARSKVTVALSGDGGDELFAGYLWTSKELWLERYRGFPRVIRRALESVLVEKNYEPLREKGLHEKLKRFLYDARLSPLESFSRRARCFQPWMLEKLYQPYFRESLSARFVLADHEIRVRSRPVMDRLLYLDSTVYLPDDLLTKVDRMSMAHSLEVRVPLLDHKVVELAARMPFSLKLKNRTTKYILKKTMRGLLPPSILKQRKQGFSIPIHRWFQKELYGMAEKLLLKEPRMIQRYFRPEGVRQILEDHRAGRQIYGAQIYTLVVLEMWGRRSGVVDRNV